MLTAEETYTDSRSSVDQVITFNLDLLRTSIVSQRDNATFLGRGGDKLQQFSEIYVVPAIATRWQIWIGQLKK